jgi:predicted ATPase
MKIHKIYFDAFKSLLNNELLITHNCHGFVGTNESGKSNVLLAINVMNGDRPLTLLDSPKMSKTQDPTLRFIFNLDSKEQSEIEKKIHTWIKEYTSVNITDVDVSKIEICLFVVFDKKENVEKRFFTINGIKLDKNCLVLINEKSSSFYKIKIQNNFIPINKSVIVKKREVADNDYKHIYDILEVNSNRIEDLESQLDELNKIVAGIDDPNSESLRINNPKIESLKKEIAKHKTNKLGVEPVVKGFNIYDIKNNLNREIISINNNLTQYKTELVVVEDSISELEKIETRTAEEEEKLVSQRLRKDQLITIISETEENKEKAEATLNEIEIPLNERYTSNLIELQNHLLNLLENDFTKYLPKVVFWEYSPKFILKSEYQFSEFLNYSNFDDISRPLLNIFRVGLEIKTFDELTSTIHEIQLNPNERSRLEKKMNLRINEFIKSAWQDYDQEVKISLEKDQIRIEIFDPKNEDASYYNMQERSQGCQTFLSFILTVAAETNKGVINNTILLLDEPETHLHPSGVRYMLQELIKISERDNHVFYATHSIFLIDRNNLDRHIILKKELEETKIIPSNVGRIGYFMQEEVLYNTLDLDVGKDFTISKKFNFVFEGDGDAIIFENYYGKILKKEERPFQIENSTFNQGGKCSDIQKYFTKRGIQMGTKWVFILDNDSPANTLKKYLEGRYKQNLNKDVFIFQYSKPDIKSEIELEDLLSNKIILETFIDILSTNYPNANEESLTKIINEEKNFSAQIDKILDSFVEDTMKEFVKSKFKEQLNSKIKNLVKPIKEKGDFQIIFPEYLNWIEPVMEQLKQK